MPSFSPAFHTEYWSNSEYGSLKLTQSGNIHSIVLDMVVGRTGLGTLVVLFNIHLQPVHYKNHVVSLRFKKNTIVSVDLWLKMNPDIGWSLYLTLILACRK